MKKLFVSLAITMLVIMSNDQAHGASVYQMHAAKKKKAKAAKKPLPKKGASTKFKKSSTPPSPEQIAGETLVSHANALDQKAVMQDLANNHFDKFYLSRALQYAMIAALHTEKKPIGLAGISQETSPQEIEAQEKFIPIASALLKAGAEEYALSIVLCHAAEHGWANIVDFCLRNNANPDYDENGHTFRNYYANLHPAVQQVWQKYQQEIKTQTHEALKSHKQEWPEGYEKEMQQQIPTGVEDVIGSYN